MALLRSVRVEAGDPVTVLYAQQPATMPHTLHVQLGDVRLVGKPAAMVELLGRALSECYAAWGGGQVAAGDYQGSMLGQGNGDFHVSVISPGFTPPSVSSSRTKGHRVLEAGWIDHPTVEDEPWPVA